MILRDKSGNEYAAHFRHIEIPIYEERGFSEAAVKVGGLWSTECTFHAGRCKRVDGEKGDLPCETSPRQTGVAKCSVRDQFKRVTGRKLALQRAMRNSGFHIH